MPSTRASHGTLTRPVIAPGALEQVLHQLSRRNPVPHRIGMGVGVGAGERGVVVANRRHLKLAKRWRLWRQPGGGRALCRTVLHRAAARVGRRCMCLRV